MEMEMNTLDNNHIDDKNALQHTNKLMHPHNKKASSFYSPHLKSRPISKTKMQMPRQTALILKCQ